MTDFKGCPMLNKLEEADYPTKVHSQLLCPDLVSDPSKDIINVTWIYTFQGLENKVIVFVPGDEAMPEDTDEEYLIEALLNIPCPGLEGKEDEICYETAPDEVDVDTGSESNGGTSECESGNGEDDEVNTDGDFNVPEDRSEFSIKPRTLPGQTHVGFSEQEKLCESCPCSLRADDSNQERTEIIEKVKDHQKCSFSLSESQKKSLEDYIFKITDIDHYTRWDKSNLFIAASRCTSQLILITR